MMVRKEPWFLDVADHPISPLQPMYTSGRVNNEGWPQCPYCGYVYSKAPKGVESITGVRAKCKECKARYTYDYDPLFGFNSRAHTCTDKHMYVMCYVEDNGVKTCKCIMCESVRRTTGNILSSHAFTQDDVDVRMKEIRQ